MHLGDMGYWAFENLRKVDDIPRTAEGPVLEHMRFRSTADTYGREKTRKYDMIRKEHREIFIVV